MFNDLDHRASIHAWVKALTLTDNNTFSIKKPDKKYVKNFPNSLQECSAKYQLLALSLFCITMF